ncbi:MAG: hypothetical protein ABIJ97_17825, partial [Bacteroidota bacterium]
MNTSFLTGGAMRTTFILKSITVLIIVSIIVLYSNITILADDYYGAYDQINPLNMQQMASYSANGITIEEISKNINQYTGQYSETFPLLNIPGLNGLDYHLYLGYNGNVGDKVVKPNYVVQSDEYGLGFSLNTEYIICNNMKTLTLSDDEFVFKDINGSVELLKNGSKFVAKDGRLWDISAEVGIVDGAIAIIGWRIVKDDGRIYKYGDFNDGSSDRNSTSYVLRWGECFSFGVESGTDSKYPMKWYISRIELADPVFPPYDSLPSTIFEYQQELQRVIVDYDEEPCAPCIVYSDNYYTRANHLKSVKTDGGYKAEFTFSNRDDYVLRHFPIDYIQYYSARKINDIILLNPYSDTLSKISLSYDYLNSDGTNEDKKLILDHITNYFPQGDTSTLSVEFEYYTESDSLWFGSIESVKYHSGGLKKIEYKVIEPDSIFTNLMDSIILPNFYQWESWGISDGNFISQRTNNLNNSEIATGIWNDGYWLFDYYTEPRIVPEIDCPAVSDNLFQAHLNQYTEEIYVTRWDEGFLTYDTISPSWMPPDTQRCRLVAGEDYLIMFDISDEGTHKISLFNYDETTDNWDEQRFLPINRTCYILSMGRMIDGFAMVLATHISGNDYSISVRAGKYRKEIADSCYIGEVNLGTIPIDDVSVAIGADKLAMESSAGNLLVYYWNNEKWQLDTLHNIDNFNNWDIKSFWQSDDVLLVSVWDSERYISAVYKSDTGWVVYNELFGNVNGVYDIIRSSSTAGLLKWPESSSSLVIMIGRNSGNWYADTLGILDSCSAIKMNDEVLCAISNGKLIAKRHLGNGDWSNTDTLMTNASITCAPAYAFATKNTQAAIGLFDNKIFAGDGESVFFFEWKDSVWIKDSLDGIISSGWADFQNTGSAFNIIINSTKIYALRSYRNQFYGKPRCPVVQSIKLYEYPNDTNPIKVQFSYSAGIMDRELSTPRFAKSSVTTPFFESDSALGYRISHYFNDINISGFPDSSIYNIMSFPNLLDTSLGVDGAGYKIDGLNYLAYASSVMDTAGTSFDTVINNYYVKEYDFDQVRKHIYKAHLKSNRQVMDGVCNTSQYYYDNYGRICKTMTPLFDDLVKYDSICYDDFADRLNLMSFNSSAISWIESDDTTIFISRSDAVCDVNAIVNDNLVGIGSKAKIATFSDASAWPSTRIFNTCSGMTYYNNDSGIAEPDVDTHIVSITNGMWDTPKYMFYNMELCQMQDSNNTVVKLKRYGEDSLILVDSLMSDQRGNCLNNGHKEKRGLFSINNGDSIWFILDNSYSYRCSAESPEDSSSYCNISTVKVSETSYPSDYIYSYKYFDEWQDHGLDRHGNVLCWTQNSYDTMATQYCESGFNQVATVSNAFAFGRECLYLDGEDGFENWSTVGSENANIVSIFKFTGNYSILSADAVADSVLGLYYSLDAENLVSDIYILSTWCKNAIAEDIPTVRVIGYDNDTICYNVSKMGDDTTAWNKIDLVCDLSSVNSLDSLNIHLGVTGNNTNGLLAYYDDVRFGPIDAIFYTSTYDSITGLVKSSSGQDNYPVKYYFDEFNRISYITDYKDNVLS